MAVAHESPPRKLTVIDLYSAVIVQVNLALSQMGMGHIENSLVGGVVNRGISGGEKRRLSIAIQLIQDPGRHMTVQRFV